MVLWVVTVVTSRASCGKVSPTLRGVAKKCDGKLRPHQIFTPPPNPNPNFLHPAIRNYECNDDDADDSDDDAD